MRILLIGASGTVGQAVAGALAHHELIRAGRHSGDVRVDLTDMAEVERMYREVGPLDAVVTAAGHVHFGALVDTTPAQFMSGLQDKLMGQVNAVLAGIGAAGALLALVTWAFLKFSVRLPIGPFFTVTSALLVVMAVVFVGHGVAALQEAGVVNSTQVNFVSVPLLGIHPNLQGIGWQLLATAAIVLGVWWNRRSAHGQT